MHSVPEKVKISAKERSLRRKGQIMDFFAEVDSGKIADFVTESSFEAYVASIRSKSSSVQKQMKPTGADCLQFKIYCPYLMFCALTSQFTFDRSSDITFR